MSQPSLLEALRERVLLADGAMGTEIQNAGLESGGCGEAWNLDHPERVLRVQRRYVEAGSDILLSHTFGACRIMLNRHGEGERSAEINRAAVRIARKRSRPTTCWATSDLSGADGALRLSPADVSGLQGAGAGARRRRR
jgi:5-methyltetrahydrofolate--homocysteine methyltransferase